MTTSSPMRRSSPGPPARISNPGNNPRRWLTSGTTAVIGAHERPEESFSTFAEKDVIKVSVPDGNASAKGSTPTATAGKVHMDGIRSTPSGPVVNAGPPDLP